MKTLIYCVQPYWDDGRRLAHGALRQFTTPQAALRAGEAAARQLGGAVVYLVEGDPEFDDWGDPVLLASHGLVPAA
jgi:hypothetical protein